MYTQELRLRHCLRIILLLVIISFITIQGKQTKKSQEKRGKEDSKQKHQTKLGKEDVIECDMLMIGDEMRFLALAYAVNNRKKVTCFIQFEESATSLSFPKVIGFTTSPDDFDVSGSLLLRNSFQLSADELKEVMAFLQSTNINSMKTLNMAWRKMNRKDYRSDWVNQGAVIRLESRIKMTSKVTLTSFQANPMFRVSVNDFSLVERTLTVSVSIHQSAEDGAEPFRFVVENGSNVDSGPKEESAEAFVVVVENTSTLDSRSKGKSAEAPQDPALESEERNPGRKEESDESSKKSFWNEMWVEALLGTCFSILLGIILSQAFPKRNNVIRVHIINENVSLKALGSMQNYLGNSVRGSTSASANPDVVLVLSSCIPRPPVWTEHDFHKFKLLKQQFSESKCFIVWMFPFVESRSSVNAAPKHSVPEGFFSSFAAYDAEKMTIATIGDIALEQALRS